MINMPRTELSDFLRERNSNLSSPQLKINTKVKDVEKRNANFAYAEEYKGNGKINQPEDYASSQYLEQAEDFEEFLKKLYQSLEMKFGYASAPIYSNNSNLSSFYDFSNSETDNQNDSHFFDSSNNYFETAFKNYACNHAKDLKNYLEGEGREFYDLEAITTDALQKDAIASVETQGDKAALKGSYNFEQKVNELANQYGISHEMAERYVFDHEAVHLSQKGKNYNEISAEYDVENTLKNYYSEMALQNPESSAMYQSLANLAEQRSSEVSLNYGSESSYSSAA